MVAYSLKRLAYSAVTLCCVAFIIFFMIHLVPGDPATVLLGIRATPATVRELRHDLGLDRSIFTQFRLWSSGVLRGNFGTSAVAGVPTLRLVLSQLPATVFLCIYSSLLSLLIGIPLGVIAAVKREKFSDHAIRLGILAAISVPAFWLGTMFIIIFSLQLRWLPASGYGIGFWQHLWYLFLPALVMAHFQVGVLARNLRSSVIDTQAKPYVSFARLRGLSTPLVMRRYVLRNASTSTLTVVTLNFGLLLSSSVVVENVFSIPGTGSLLLSSVFARDYTVIQAITLIYAAFIMGINLATDLVYPFIDPRIKLS